MNPPARVSRIRFVIGGVFLLAFGALAFSVLRLATFAINPWKPGVANTADILLQKGDGPREIVRTLVAQGALDPADADRMIWFGRLTRKWSRVKAGEYRVSPAMTPIELFSTLTSGVSIAHPLTVREGLNRYEIADQFEGQKLMSRARFLELSKDPQFIATLGLEPPPPSLEGYLYPETYHFTRSQTPEDMIRQMVRKFKAVWGDAENRKAQALGMTRQEVITLASMIEKETGAPQERPLISSVFHNRLRKKMKLQSDPTTIYGIWENYKGNIHRSDLLNPTPYNTYTVPALPAGPIANPGKEAILAALSPAMSEYLFFVSHNDGTHEFTRTFTDHSQAVRKFQLDPKAREGKSWRDLKTKPVPN